VDDKLMTDLTSIGTLFAFALVSGGVLLLPFRKKESGKFQIPYINSKWIVPMLYIVFVVLTWDRFQTALLHLNDEGYQEILFIIFIVLAGLISVFSFLKNFSLIPVLGVICCLYLMIEIPAKSWLVFFGWMALGLTIYYFYGYKKSRLAANRTS
jgi:hypothetical protein